MFKHQDDLTLYDFIVNARLSEKGHENLVIFNFSRLNKAKLLNEYLEFINKDSIKTIIDGGACDGLSTLAFLFHFKNIENIYGFEPLYDEFKKDAFLQNAGNFK